MVFLTLKIIGFFFKKNFSEFSNFKVSVLFFLIVAKPYYELVNNIFFSAELQFILFIFSFIWRYFDFGIKFCFLTLT